ncbi:MAG: ECF-type sigma factor [Gemmataceae bacterium]
MSDIADLLNAVKAGDRVASAALLPLVYEELRSLAANRLSNEQSNQTLQPTALVHEVYLRLIGPTDAICWENERHFFAAAAEAMRRILVDTARRKAALQHGGDRKRVALQTELLATEEIQEDLVALDDALNRLAETDSIKAELVKLRFFAGLSLAEAALTLGISERTAGRHWTFARAWLRREVEGVGEKSEK